MFECETNDLPISFPNFLLDSVPNTNTIKWNTLLSLVVASGCMVCLQRISLISVFRSAYMFLISRCFQFPGVLFISHKSEYGTDAIGTATEQKTDGV